ncbi:MAG: HAD family hydrolase [Verrucomicrobiia bacterium]|jgi:phosphoglycolate phosphatase
MMVRNVILDWSGTLVDDLMPVFKTTNHVLEACGCPPITLREFRAEFCLPIRKFYQRRIPDVPQATLEKIFLAQYPEWRDDIRLLPHTLGFLRFCARRGFGVYIASTVDRETYHYQTKRFGIEDYITKPYIGIEDKTQQIHQILHENALVPSQTLFVGDMEHDIEAGKAGGVHTCAVLTGYNHVEKLRAMSPDLICEHLGELQRTLVERDRADAQRQQRPSRGIAGPDSVRGDGEPKKQRAGP